MAKTVNKKAASKDKDWDSEENEAQSINFGFGRCTDEDYKGDRILGVLLSKRQVPNRLSKIAGAMQWVYEVKVRECEFHPLEKAGKNKGRPVEESVVIDEGEIVNVYGKAFFDGRMRQVKPGQVFGLKYVEDLPATTPGNNDTKAIKTFLPKDSSDEYEMDDEVVAQLENDGF